RRRGHGNATVVPMWDTCGRRLIRASGSNECDVGFVVASDSPRRATGVFPEVRYADADGVSIAFSVRGDGPLDLVMVPGNLSGILSCMVDPDVEAWLVKLARFARVIRLDRRGLGLSDPFVAGGATSAGATGDGCARGHGRGG